MNTVTKIVLRAASALIAMALVICLGAVAHAYHERTQAERFLAVLQKIQVGTTDRATVIRMTSPFSSHREEYVRDEPQLEFLFYNEWLSRLKLATPAEFRANVTFKDGVVGSKQAWEAVNASGAAARVRERKRGFGYADRIAPGDRPNHFVRWEDHWPQIAPEKVRRILIEDDDTYPESLRQKDWAFDLSCMTRLGSGCWDAHFMLPNAVRPPE